jgi:cytochrome P450
MKPHGQSIVGINAWVAHFNKDVYGSDAESFRPERWDPEITPPEQLQRMEQYHLPFGAGTGTCIGKNISLLEMMKIIPELVCRYDMELLNNHVESTNHWFVKQKDVRVRLRPSQ